MKPLPNTIDEFKALPQLDNEFMIDPGGPPVENLRGGSVVFMDDDGLLKRVKADPKGNCFKIPMMGM